MQYSTIFIILSAITMMSISGIDNLDTKISSPDTVLNESSLQEQFSSSVGDSVFFDTSSYSIRPADIQVLSNLGSWLEKHDCDFLIEGHADELGSRNSSIALGLRRAYAVFNYFVARGISASRMKVTSYGKEMPSVYGHDEDAYAKNRRAIVFLKGCRANT
ncbi:OmpA family protein [Candidatus Liberibacter asiaticus]|uniref:OmpA/MotB n=2 Tax=Liberibacter asiaticus TaxID=34021 RepID=C6XF68_LIBAP|nr:OmpA family protein [Candidatus Liberibacter asiaticus]ACT57020.1 OmpA/MotB [Candidatus Liberibacter asiaticus str. psy62]AGH17014.1 OmpA/MotB [Candidatus Liberibacter asiaticus str. gxpsy]ALK07343.1 OmpA family protein [Candidatus Liberibacter asiaticus]ASK52835.1 flagellar motor protein MotB [Candidatus Liberibacter asiaticus]AWL14152.1 flagellar motor protein MotB [Candidatus Liberibacter asiaticus]